MVEALLDVGMDLANRYGITIPQADLDLADGKRGAKPKDPSAFGKIKSRTDQGLERVKEKVRGFTAKDA